jgi:hypothetical protein
MLDAHERSPEKQNKTAFSRSFPIKLKIEIFTARTRAAIYEQNEVLLT